MRIDDAKSWISKTVEGTFNTAESTGSNYEQVPTKNPTFILPKLEKLSDAGRSGHTAATHLCPHYWSPGKIGFSDDLETNTPARLARRGLGGSSTNTLVATGVYDHEFGILPPQTGSILPSFGVAGLLDAASFLMHGCMVDSFKISGGGDKRAQFESSIVNSGKFTNPHGLSSLPELADTPCMDSFRTVVTYLDSDGSTTINLTSVGKLIEWMVEHKNNIKTNKRREGDTIQTASSGGSGAHVRRMPRGKYETMASLKLDFLDLSDWAKSTKNEVMTNLKIKVVGPVFATVSSVDYRHEFEIIIPKFSFETVDPDSDDDDAAVMVNVIPLEDPVTYGTMTMRVRNGNATLV